MCKQMIKQLKKNKFKKIQLNIENTVMIIIKHL